MRQHIWKNSKNQKCCIVISVSKTSLRFFSACQEIVFVLKQSLQTFSMTYLVFVASKCAQVFVDS